MSKTRQEEAEEIQRIGLFEWAARKRLNGEVKNIAPLRYPADDGPPEVEYPLDTSAFKNTNFKPKPLA